MNIQNGSAAFYQPMVLLAPIERPDEKVSPHRQNAPQIAPRLGCCPDSRIMEQVRLSIDQRLVIQGFDTFVEGYGVFKKMG